MRLCNMNALHMAYVVGLAGILMANGCRNKDRILEYVQQSRTMMPNYKQNENVVVDTAAYRTATPHRWDVIVFRTNATSNAQYMSRVAGLPGEQVEIKNGGLLINDEVVLPPAGTFLGKYVSNEGALFAIGGKCLTPSNSVFVLCDNSAVSRDSRHFGAVPTNWIIGLVVGRSPQGRSR